MNKAQHSGLRFWRQINLLFDASAVAFALPVAFSATGCLFGCIIGFFLFRRGLSVLERHAGQSVFVLDAAATPILLVRQSYKQVLKATGQKTKAPHTPQCLGCI